MTCCSKMKIFDGSAHPDLTDEICRYLNTKKGKVEITNYNDGEIKIKVDESVRGLDVFVIQPTPAPVNDNLMKLLIMIDALKRASAARISAVIPYYGYARQDKKSQGREPITAKLVANLITTAGVDRLLCVDLHTSAIQGFFDIPVDHTSAVPLLGEYFRKKNLSDLVVVSPDAGGVSRARTFAKKVKASLAIIDKRRPKPNEAEVLNIVGEVKGKQAVLLDDMIDTGRTIVRGAEALARAGARAVYACCTHPVFSGEAADLLENSVIEEVVVTNTVPLSSAVTSRLKKIRYLSIAPLLGEIIKRIHENLSVSELFD